MTKARADQADPAAELSEAARAVVRDAGDPRIDAHLRALGLTMEDAEAPGAEELPAGAPAAEAPHGGLPAAEAESQPAVVPAERSSIELEQRVSELELALASARQRLTWVTALLVATIVVAVVLAALLLVQ
jgi:hypothetical protein